MAIRGLAPASSNVNVRQFLPRFPWFPLFRFTTPTFLPRCFRLLHRRRFPFLRLGLVFQKGNESREAWILIPCFDRCSFASPAAGGVRRSRNRWVLTSATPPARRSSRLAGTHRQRRRQRTARLFPPARRWRGTSGRTLEETQWKHGDRSRQVGVGAQRLDSPGDQGGP